MAIFTTLFLPAYCQPKKALDFFTASVTGQYYFNKAYVKNDANTEHLLKAVNTAGYRIGLGFEHITRYGLILSSGLEYGWQKHNVTAVYRFNDFDPDAKIALKNLEINQSIKVTGDYLYPYLMAGYQYPISGRYTIVGKVGLGATLFLSGLEKTLVPTITYATDDGAENRIVQFGQEKIALGETQEVGKRPTFSAPISTGEFYLGLDRRISGKFVKKMSLGFTLTRAVFWNNSGQSISLNSSVRLNDGPRNSDHYYNRNFSIGLRFGFGL